MNGELTLHPLDGALRVRLDEADWGAAAAGLEVEGPLQPVLPSSDVPVEEALRQAVSVAITGPVLVRLTTAARDRGLVASIGCDGRSCAGVARVVLPAGRQGPEAAAVPGVEVSAFTPVRLVAEVLRLLPPDRPVAAPDAREPVVLSQTVALMFSKALRDGDEPLLQELALTNGLEEVPELLRELDREISGNATIVFEPAPAAPGIDAASRPRVRKWVQCGAGWVAISIADGKVTHRPVDREQIAATLVEELAIMLERSPAVVG